MVDEIFQEMIMKDKKCDKSLIQRYTLEILQVVKIREKREEQAFKKEVKTFQPQTALPLPTLLQLQAGQDQQHNSSNIQDKHAVAS